MFCNISLHFRSKWSKVTRWSDLGPVEGSVLLHQWDDRIQSPSTNQKPGKRANQKAGYKKKQPIDSIYLFLVWKDKFLLTKTLKLVEICKDISETIHCTFSSYTWMVIGIHVTGNRFSWRHSYHEWRIDIREQSIRFSTLYCTTSFCQIIIINIINKYGFTSFTPMRKHCVKPSN
jgi:hypothetical protein